MEQQVKQPLTATEKHKEKERDEMVACWSGSNVPTRYSF